jgi:exodeoxyribonuclease VII large subunit
MEDLWCFNEEPVVRAIFASQIPTVSAVGHEIDVTLADLVADVRALTPSEAAELVIPSREELVVRMQQFSQRLVAGLQAQAQRARMRLDALANRPALARPFDRVHDLARRVDELAQRASRAARHAQTRQQDRLHGLAGRLESLSPLAVLGRGYSVTTDEQDQLILSSQDVKVGDRIVTRLAGGRLRSQVTEQDE